ncbi:hypothetical protein [Dendronalium sp. ChiSLP03b]|nr:hypothetical protein [Dendronalium sp. ChiSLP03b]MDZ8204014.1 hypothetical protein [Dendronalium sp. ChiSLP03b]
MSRVTAAAAPLQELNKKRKDALIRSNKRSPELRYLTRRSPPT